MSAYTAFQAEPDAAPIFLGQGFLFWMPDDERSLGDYRYGTVHLGDGAEYLTFEHAPVGTYGRLVCLPEDCGAVVELGEGTLFVLDYEDRAASLIGLSPDDESQGWINARALALYQRQWVRLELHPLDPA